MAQKKTLKIGNAGGYWGDDPKALERQITKGHLDYVTIDFLAEVTMSILKKQKAKDPNLGYASDFVKMLATTLPLLLKSKTKIITNAGGINPQECARAVFKLATDFGFKPKIAVVYGDDILPCLDDLEKRGARFQNMETGENFSKVKKNLEAANVYFGALPVVRALEQWNPDIIITGRVTDTGITLAPMIYEFKWSFDDWDRLASGIVAGHLIECGSQVTGGNFSDWHKVASFKEMGYPVVEVSEDGSFVLTKHENTGGLVNIDTVREQIFYEMGDPKAYITPDVVADFSTISLAADGKNRVKVSGIKGFEPTPYFKVSMAYRDGYKTTGTILISGPEARKKAEAFSQIFWDRCEDTFEETLTEYLGWNACHQSLNRASEASEIVLRLSARSFDSEKLNRLGKLVSSLILGGPAGVAVLGGSPKPQSLISYWPSLMEKKLVHPVIALFDGSLKDEQHIREQISGNFIPQKSHVQIAEAVQLSLSEIFKHQDEKGNAPLFKVALGRSGDKGDTANIGICARNEKTYAFLCEYLTAQRVKDLFQELCFGKVLRYEVEGLLGLNFLLEESLGGGGSCTLRADAQGKTFAQALLQQRFPFPQEVLMSVSQ